MPVIYIDVLFAVNLIVNYLLLKISSIFTGVKFNSIRVTLASVIGAVYAILVFFPDFTVIHSTIYKLLISLLINAIAFPFYSIRSYIKALLVFYCVSFGFGGCVLGVFYFTNVGAKLGAVYSNGILYFNLPWTILALSGALFYAIIKIFYIISKRNLNKKNLRKKVLLHYKNKTAEITALLDTGNSLIDPISLSPVIIAEYNSLKNLFSGEIQNILDRIDDDNIEWIIKSVCDKGLSLRLIPFSSIGKENGMLLGFVPDKAEIYDDCGIRVLGKCVIALCKNSLSKDKSYRALLNPYL